MRIVNLMLTIIFVLLIIISFFLANGLIFLGIGIVGILIQFIIFNTIYRKY